MQNKLPNPQIGYTGVYGRIAFPPYEFVEFPKYVRKGKKEALVHSAREELEVLTRWGEEAEGLGEENDAPKDHPAIQEALKAVKERDALQEQMAVLQKQMAELLAAKVEPVKAPPPPAATPTPVKPEVAKK